MSSPLRPSSWSVTMTTPPRRRSVHGSSSPSLSPSVSHSPSPSISPSSSHSFVVDFERSSVRTPASTRYKSRASSITLPYSSGGCGAGKGSDGDGDGDGPAMLLGTAASRRYVPPMALLGSIIAVLVLTAGAASLMTAWLYAHKMPLKSPGVLYVNEGNEEERGREYRDEALGPNGRLRFDEQVSHPTTLTISSVTSTLLGYSLEPLMALVAYRLAADWLTLQRRFLQQSPLHSRSPSNSQSPRHAEAIDLPTPLQYALLAQLTSKVSLGAMVNTLRHRLLAHGSQARVPAMLRRALAWSLVLFLLNFSIANLDVLLHETTRTVAVADVDAVLSSKPYGFALNRTLCSSSSGDASAPCLFDATTRRFAATVSTKAIGAEGFLTATNASQSRLVQTFFDRGLDSDTARSTVYLTNPKVHRAEYAAALQTTGVSCHCRVVTPQCRATTSSFDCTPLGHPELKVDAVTVATGEGDGDGAALLGVNNAIHVGQLPSSTSRLPLAVQLVYPVEGVDNAHTGFQTISPLVGNASHAYVLALCELEYLDLGLSYFNGTYTLESQASADAPLATALSGPLLAGEVTAMAASALAKAAGRVPSDDYASELGHAIGYHALALVGGLFEPQMVAVRQWRRILAQQYNFYLVAIFIGLLYAYALAAIIVFFWAWSVSSDTVSYYNDAHEKVEVPAALLAQRRLVDPITHLVQDHLSGGHAHALSPRSGHVSYPTHHHHHHHLQQSPSPSPSPSLHSASASVSGHHREKSEAALRTARRKMLQVFDEPRDQERVVIAVHDGGRGFGVWPASAARGTSC
ncbi:hypothetical protein FA10DRAFT_285407 [Acaromyces ingoldii]|uniref:Uncharacterized protein n=1 Tax=Acaromyces ingoldii TaxID=215250 RepID=A0A316YT09_9BASI|nr:hypothetical protein FA10DRAFT_285407 [Acaromyces ingoldii]PWN92547.1 hypothetical protein FA10DRAFT_285407 [Acaromyces ingoldii]